MIITSIVLALFGICFYVKHQKPKLIETFMPPLTYKRDLDVTMSYTPPRDVTSTLSPRIGNVSYGANINYRMPENNLLAVEPLNPLGVSEDGELQPIIYDRYMYANKKSRLSSQGDSIRGDLPIMPAKGNWFTPSVTPHIDLKEGAMNVLGGQFNDTSNELSQMKYRLTAGADNIASGSLYHPVNDFVKVKETSGMIPLYQEIINRVGDVTVSTMMP